MRLLAGFLAGTSSKPSVKSSEIETIKSLLAKDSYMSGDENFKQAALLATKYRNKYPAEESRSLIGSLLEPHCATRLACANSAYRESRLVEAKKMVDDYLLALPENVPALMLRDLIIEQQRRSAPASCTRSIG